MNQLLWEFYGPHVQSGPFKDMLISQKVAQSTNNEGNRVGIRLTGNYEIELHPAINKAISRNPHTIVNIGSAEGYYAIGLALALPNAKVRAIDIDDECQIICTTNAEKNHCADRVTTCKSFFPKETDLMIIDCESCELDLLSPSLIKNLKNCDLIIECHDFMIEGISQTLKDRFLSTHDIEVIAPNYEIIHSVLLPSGTNLEIQDERPENMSWLVCWSREKSLA